MRSCLFRYKLPTDLVWNLREQSGGPVGQFRPLRTELFPNCPGTSWYNMVICQSKTEQMPLSRVLPDLCRPQCTGGSCTGSYRALGVEDGVDALTTPSPVLRWLIYTTTFSPASLWVVPEPHRRRAEMLEQIQVKTNPQEGGDIYFKGEYNSIL